MENQEILNKETGTKESVALKPARVKIEAVEVVEVGEKKNKKLVCNVKHPDKEELIKLSSIKHEAKGKLEVDGLWANLDEDGLIRKGSALSVLLSFTKSKTPTELIGKELETVEDNKGYLVFKAY